MISLLKRAASLWLLLVLKFGLTPLRPTQRHAAKVLDTNAFRLSRSCPATPRHHRPVVLSPPALYAWRRRRWQALASALPSARLVSLARHALFDAAVAALAHRHARRWVRTRVGGYVPADDVAREGAKAGLRVYTDDDGAVHADAPDVADDADDADDADGLRDREGNLRCAARPALLRVLLGTLPSGAYKGCAAALRQESARCSLFMRAAPRRMEPAKLISNLSFPFMLNAIRLSQI
eukprot:6196345-Pleurochrysis_carterae.AAC.2